MHKQLVVVVHRFLCSAIAVLWIQNSYTLEDVGPSQVKNTYFGIDMAADSFESSDMQLSHKHVFSVSVLSQFDLSNESNNYLNFYRDENLASSFLYSIDSLEYSMYRFKLDNNLPNYAQESKHQIDTRLYLLYDPEPYGVLRPEYWFQRTFEGLSGYHDLSKNGYKMSFYLNKVVVSYAY